MMHSAQEPGEATRTIRLEPVCLALGARLPGSSNNTPSFISCSQYGTSCARVQVIWQQLCGQGEHSSFRGWADGSDACGLPQDVLLAMCGRTRVQTKS